MGKQDLMPLAEEERAELLDFVRGLTPSQWRAPSLCTDWTVRDVAVHIVSYDELSMGGLVGTFARGGLRVSGVNRRALAAYDDLDPDGVVDLVARTQKPRGLTAGFRGAVALTDGTIHHQDMRRALGLPRRIPERRLVPVLDFALGAPTLPARKNAKGLELVATDLGWRTGNGPTVSGPGEALLMAVTGRRSALADLSGPGVDVLAGRVG